MKVEYECGMPSCKALRAENQRLKEALKVAEDLLREFQRTIDDDHFYRERTVEAYLAVKAALQPERGER